MYLFPLTFICIFNNKGNSRVRSLWIYLMTNISAANVFMSFLQTFTRFDRVVVPL